MKKEVQKKNKEELKKDLDTKVIALRDIRFNAAGTKSKNVKEQRTTRKDIARIKTVLKNM